MNKNEKKQIVFCAALPGEVRSFCHRLKIPVPTKKQPFVEISITDQLCFVVAVSGVGYARMKNLLQSFSPLPVHCWVSMGYAGALVPQIPVGKCIIGNQIITEKKGVIQTYSGLDFTEPTPSGALLCSESLLTAFQEKVNAHQKTGAVAVDMESAAVAEVAKIREENFFWIRVITDSVTDSIPEALISCMDKDGFPSGLAALGLLVRHPFLLGSFLRFGLRTRQAGRQLANSAFQMVLGHE